MSNTVGSCDNFKSTCFRALNLTLYKMYINTVHEIKDDVRTLIFRKRHNLMTGFNIN